MVELPTRALSLIQPWAWAVVHGPKDVENRVWWSEIRGPFWIAASAQVTRRYYEEAKQIIEAHAPGFKVPRLDDLDYGCIVGRATISDVILPGGYVATTDDRSRNAAALFKAYGADWGNRGGYKLMRHPFHGYAWHFVEQYGYILTDRAALSRSVPCKGHQRWWTVPAPVLAQLREVA